ncbi:MAG TPA: hypothetical protein VGP83_16900 [Pyrinomonadaceae bacterium]|jgi:hypothetical protein|nr:hypothetical protein [Pyrinomonadaceae bacterium]
MLARRPDWQQRLQWYLTCNSTTVFHYGTFDCGLFVCDAIREMTDIDLAANYRERYDSRAGAKALMQLNSGTGSLLEVTEEITEHFGMLKIRPPFAQRGDVVLLKRSREYSLGLIALDGCEILTCYHRGFVRLPFHRALRAWRV